MLELLPVAVDDADPGQRHKAVEEVETIRFEIVDIHENHTKEYLHKDGQVGHRDRPPQLPSSQRHDPVSGKRPRSSEDIESNVDPSKCGMYITKTHPRRVAAGDVEPIRWRT